MAQECLENKRDDGTLKRLGVQQLRCEIWGYQDGKNRIGGCAV